MSWLVLPPLVWGLRRLMLFWATRWAESDVLRLAAFAYTCCLLLWPFSAQIWTRWANVLGDLNCWKLAHQGFSLARWLQPQWIDAHLGLGTVMLAQAVSSADSTRIESADRHFLQAYLLRRGLPRWGLDCLPHDLICPVQPLAEPKSDPLVSAHFEKQWQWLQQQGLVSEGHQAAAAQRAHYLVRPAAIKGLTLQTLDQQGLESQYAEQGFVVCDDLLAQQVLRTLWQSCLQNTFWHHAYSQGYLGAYLDDGLGSPLLYQVAAELQATLPGIFAGQRLMYAWAFKCLGHTSGVALHYDAATINVNLWLTPESANLTPESGGLCLYPEPPPADWDLARYALSQAQMHQVIQNQRMIPIAYRQNRAVIFDSRLLHSSQAVNFAPAHEQQRINLTFLFGTRPLRHHPKMLLPSARTV